MLHLFYQANEIHVAWSMAKAKFCDYIGSMFMIYDTRCLFTPSLLSSDTRNLKLTPQIRFTLTLHFRI